MSEKETPDTTEENVSEETPEEPQEVQTEEASEQPSEELEASEEAHEEVSEEAPEEPQEVQAEEASEQPSEEAAEEAPPPAPQVKKGLMERRPSFSQSSVPNAHRGYSTNPPIIMLLIISVFILLSIIFATAAIV